MTTGGYGPNLTVLETQLTRCQETPLCFDQGTTLERRERLAPLGSSEECPRQDRAQRLEVVCPPGSGLQEPAAQTQSQVDFARAKDSIHRGAY